VHDPESLEIPDLVLSGDQRVFADGDVSEYAHRKQTDEGNQDQQQHVVDRRRRRLRVCHKHTLLSRIFLANFRPRLQLLELFLSQTDPVSDAAWPLAFV
jgi:hypothetical protein